MASRPDLPLLLAVAAAAAAGPSLLAYNPPPSPTFLNQALALALWGLFVAAAGGRLHHARLTAPLLAALALVAAGVLASWGPGMLPAPLALSALGLLAAAALLAASGAASGGEGAAARALAGGAEGGEAHDAAAPHAGPGGEAVFLAFCIGWAVAGVLNAGLAVVQVFAPAWADGDWIARSGLPGRAVGNLRQPNHLSSLLLWAGIALVPLLQAGRLRARTAALGMALLMGAVVLTASRTGLLSVLLLAGWGALDRALARPARRLLLAAPLLYALAWGGMWLWAHAGAHAFGGEARLAAGDISSSRFGIWANTLALIGRQPWAGVGFGEFNLAWSLTPFPGRPTAFFDHTHNLPLQLLVELGLPLGGAVLALLAWALWRAWRGSRAGVMARGAFVFVLMIGLHSLLEYPLWYAYFLLPAAWAWGFAMGAAGRAAGPADGEAGPAVRVAAGTGGAWASPAGMAATAPPPAATAVRGWAALAGALLVLGAAWSVQDYLRVARIFEAAPGAAPLAQRVADGRRSVLFGHHADYAAATTGLPQPDGLRVFDRPLHYLLDTRLMVAWAQALERAGQAEAARQVAARLREFGPARAQEFFGGCDTPASAAAPIACQPPGPAPDWRALVGR